MRHKLIVLILKAKVYLYFLLSGKSAETFVNTSGAEVLRLGDFSSHGV